MTTTMMMNAKASDNGLQIESGADKINPIFFLIQTILRLVFFLFVLLAVLGFFGPGYFSHKTIQRGVLSIQFEKYAHIQSSNVFTMEISKNHSNKNNFLDVWMNTSLQDYAMIKSISPKPLFETFADDKVIYRFITAPSAVPFHIIIVVEPFKMGFIQGAVGILNGESLDFKQFIYP